MPEGPEIRRAADKIARVLVGQQIESARLHLPGLAQFERRLEGETVAAVETRGKAMLTRFGNGLTLYSHNQLYGRWYTTRRPRVPKTNRQLRVELHTARDSALLYSATDVEILRSDQLDSHPFLSRIGPDVLDPDLSREALAERLQSKAFRSRSVGSLYLDQGFVAGLGNYLRSEILFVSGVEPSRRPADLRKREIDRLARATLRIARRSYRTGGITVAPSLAAQLKARGEPYGTRRFYVFGRQGEPCRQCGATIEKTAMGSRNLFFCRACQPGDIE
jgi:endonuclease-8